MTTVTLNRSKSVVVSQAYPTKPYPANPGSLKLSQVASKAQYAYLKYPIPAAALKTTTEVVSAIVRVTTKQAIAHSHTVELRRVTAPWTAGVVTWNTKPTVFATAVSQTKATAAADEVWEFDVTTQVAAMQSAKNYGWELRITGATADGHAFRNDGTFVATLEIEYNTQPPAPTAFSPSDAQTVPDAKPVVRIVAPAPEHTAIYIQVDAAQDGVSPDFEVEHDDEGTREIDLSDYVGAPALSSGAETYYRMAFVRGGNQGPYGPWIKYKYVPFPTLTLEVPDVDPDDIIYDAAPAIEWDFANQTAYRFWIEDPSLLLANQILYDSGVIAGTAQAAQTSEGVLTEHGHVYRVRLRVWDDEPRVNNGGVTGFVEVVRDFTFELDPLIDPVTSLTLIDEDPLPFVSLTWERASEPDFFQILRDGEQVAFIEGSDAFITGTQYGWTDRKASPRREHTWIVRAVNDGRTSAVNLTATMTINPSGLWLSQPDENRFLPIITMESQEVGLSEEGTTLAPLNSKYAVRISGSKRSYSGTITGEILATELTGSTTGASLRDIFLAMRAEKAVPMILTLLDRNLKIIPFNMTVAPTPTPGRDEDYVYAISFEFIEVP